ARRGRPAEAWIRLVPSQALATTSPRNIRCSCEFGKFRGSLCEQPPSSCTRFTPCRPEDWRKCHGLQPAFHPDSMRSETHGFSLPELLVATTLTLLMALPAFLLFRQNERVFRDQSLVIEMEQTARAAASQIADEIRLIGQHVPIHSGIYDSGDTEALTAIL